MNTVIKGTSYVMAHTPHMVILNGVTQTTERIVNPESEYLKKLPEHLRSYEDILAYYPNQVYIGNHTDDDLAAIEFPYYDKKCDISDRYGKFGELMPEHEFYLLMKIADDFDLVHLEKDFVAEYKDQFAKDPVVTEFMLKRLGEGDDHEKIVKLVEEEHAEKLIQGDKVVGCVKRAHDIDVNLSAHIMLENIVNKASAVLALAHGLKNIDINPDDIEYVIECGEEACGDQNQRGGGNFAKSIAEIVELHNATGSDTRSFCAAPSHAMVEAAALVKAGVYKNVAVVAGGCTAKLGMNGKDHVAKGLPILEDMIAGFCVIVGENDGVNPEIDLRYIGRHTVGTGSAPQKVISSLVADPLERAGLTALDVDKFSPEMQNPDITQPAGAGNVPEANYKMIGALSVMKKWMEKKELLNFVKQHGLVGYAPTQGHIPSGVPYVGFARENILDGSMQRVMIIGKGSLFLGRMTNLFDGISFMITPNSAKQEEENAVSKDTVRQLIAESLREFAQSLTDEETKA